MDISKHLTEEQIAFCAEAINSGKYSSIANNIQDHLIQCNECASEVVMVAEISSEISFEELKKKKPQKNYKPVFYSIAATFLLFGTIYIFHRHTNPTNNVNTIAENKSVEELIQPMDTILLENQVKENNSPENPTENNNSNNKISTSTNQQLAYINHPQLEKLAQNYRGSYRGEEVKVITKGLILFNKTDSMAWQNPNLEPLTIEIYNNKGAQSYSVTTNGNSVKIPNLQNGLYYWKLINQDYDLLFVGKIEVK
ncbi:MAG: hypothetical protein RBR35_08060 [Salinivirgaceae bacterium]|nr:hypothetical protein [Salinivirgaceae bacterium]